MREPHTIEIDELREVLSKGWMTHDAMWFRLCLDAVGPQETNRINTSAVAAMARIEARRLMRLLDVPAVHTMDELQAFLEAAAQLIRCDFMGFEPSFPSATTYRWDMPRCFAYDGVSRIGAIDTYACGIFTRLEGWLDELGIAYTVTPQIDGCMMHTQGRCHREYTFDLPNTSPHPPSEQRV